MNTAAPQATTSVMIVDDESIVTQTIKAFLQLETEYDVHTFQSPLDALEALTQTRVDLIISDFLMPEMNGLEFLAEVKRLYPDIVRVLLTGYADKENAIRAINQVELYQYLEKPWDNDQLVLVIKNGLSQRSLVAQLTDKIDELDHTLLERDRIAKKHDELKEELALARRVQEAMLPQSLPSDDRIGFCTLYEPAIEVGGDFYDAMPRADGALTLIVADATGHGIQAAMSTALIKSAFSQHAHADNPGEILRLMNDTLFRILPSEVFVAACVVIIDPDTGKLMLANAGGPHPMHLRTGATEALASNGLPLGAVDGDAFLPSDVVTAQMEPGDSVIFYTDGLSEVENDAGDEYGACCLQPFLTRLCTDGNTSDVCPALLEDARAFARDDHSWDDVTVVTVTRTR